MTNALFLSWWEGDVYSFFRALIISNTNSITSPYDSAFGKLTIFFENRTFNYLKRQQIKSKILLFSKIKKLKNTQLICVFKHCLKQLNNSRRFLVHKDANLPGSFGCIVMTPDRFKDFEKQIAKLKAKGVKKIPLQVQYS